MISQYMPAKPTKWGIKTFAICNTGYALKVLIYTGKETFVVNTASTYTYDNRATCDECY